jgi:hypothetical protein
MSPPRHQPPSRVRYAAEHPSIGIHLSIEDRERAVALRERSGLSFAQLFRQSLERVELDIAPVEETALTRGYEYGLDEAEALFKLTAPCAVCGGPMVIRPGTPMAEAAVASLARWHHHRCARSAPRP